MIKYWDVSGSVRDGGVTFLKGTTHSFVKEIALKILEAIKTAKSLEVLIEDSMKIRSLGSGRRITSMHSCLTRSGV